MRLLVLALALLAGCATVKSHRTRSDYETVDKHQVKRLVVVTQPLPAGQKAVGELWSLIARRYVNQNRDFIAKVSLARDGRPNEAPDNTSNNAPNNASFKDLCTDGIEGVLWLDPDVRRSGSGVESAVRAFLLRCSDGQEIWAAEASGSWSSEDEQYRELTNQYVNELGPDVQPYVAPTFRLLKATLDTLPNPQLEEADVDEKIELGE